MPRFHLNLTGPASVCPDHEGADFESLDHAYLEAFNGARELWSELLLMREDPRTFAIDIADADGRTVMTVPFSEVLDACRNGQAVPPPPDPTPEHRAEPARDNASWMLAIDTARADLERLRRLSRDFSEELKRARVELARAKLVVVAANRLLAHDPMRCENATAMRRRPVSADTAPDKYRE
jgi:hypothetical protein